MRPSLLPRLVNGPFDDPGLFIPFRYDKRAVLFDLGDLGALTPRDLLKISHIFVTHTHMDHFVGFDRILRLFLGRDKELYLYGPSGFLTNIQGKLAAYNWNLVANYENRFTLHATEVDGQRCLRQTYHVTERFIPANAPLQIPFSPQLLVEDALTVSSVALDHIIDCLAFSIEERFHINICKDRLESLGLTIGPWIRSFKRSLFEQRDPQSVFFVPDNRAQNQGREFVLGELADEIARITPGQKVAYIADAVYSPENREKLISLAAGADHLFIEAAFLDEDHQIAREKHHLTAKQAGTIARLAGVRQLTLFHFSPRYTDRGHLLEEEARRAFSQGLS